MAEIQCPACGAEGHAPKEKVNIRLVCKRCLTVFHVNLAGKPLLGEPPEAETTPKPKPHARAATDGTQKADEVLNLLFSPLSLILCMVLIALAAVAYLVSMQRPETLKDQATKVAEAAVQSDLQTIRRLACSGGDEDAVRWYDSTRAQCESLRAAWREKAGRRR